MVIATLGDSFTLSYKTKHRCTIWPSNLLYKYLSNVVENLCPHKNLNMKFNSSQIHNCQKLQVTKTFFRAEWRNCGNLYSGLLFRAKNKLKSYEKTWKKVKYMLISERSQYGSK